MKRGRPRDEYPVTEFLSFLLAKMRTRGITQTQLAKRSGVNRGVVSRTINGVKKGKELCPASRPVRFAFSLALDLSPEEKIRFCCVPQDGPKPMLIADYRYPRQAVLSQASALLHQGFYYAAAQEFKRVFTLAERSSDSLLQADAAGQAALVDLEMFNFNAAQQWAYKSIAKCSQCIGVPVPEIICTATPYTPDASQSKSILAARILSDTMHNLCQIYVRQMVYCGNHKLEPSARLSLQNSLQLDGRLDLAQPSGNDLRCQAVVEVISKWPNSQLALKLIDQCRDNFAPGGLFEAHRVKTDGIIALHTGKLAQARGLLTKSAEMLSSFLDVRGLASARYMLSDAILRASGERLRTSDIREALRHIISAAALHPYGVVLDRCRQQARDANRRDLQAEIDDLLAGKGQYSVVHRMAAWMADESAYTAQDLFFRNIDLMMSGNFPPVEIPNRPVGQLDKGTRLLDDQQRASRAY